MEPIKREIAQSLVCPFMAHTTDGDWTSYYECITTKCMAWKVEKDYDLVDYEKVKRGDSRQRELHYQEGMEKIKEDDMVHYAKKVTLEPLQCTGSCMRLKG